MKIENNIILGDCLDVLPKIPNSTIDMVLCDLPYFKVLKDDWDNQWNNEKEYLNWVYQIIDEYDRLLKDNANIFLFTGRLYNRYICLKLDQYFDEKRTIIWSRRRGCNSTFGKSLTSSY